MKTNKTWPKEYLKANFKVIEQDLYNYQFMKKKIEDVIEEFYLTEFEPGPNTSNIQIEPRSGGISDPAFQQVVKSLTLEQRHKKIMSMVTAVGFTEMVRQIEAIEYVLERLKFSSTGVDRLKAELIQKKYFEKRLTPEGIAQEMLSPAPPFIDGRKM
jgi:hypothetical protein